ncbi:LOW QUALITY PROTEIN: ubiquitin carboxyl-terminal hydrolase 15-like [Phoenix dactylifera]|uniref:ubiquitinyl hydrolase 1 n=1 Tax=Phoenix dactylifera TaxID=42345 RepID=A0A8B7BRN9_PHODC|nr:LOW QUALITY PROTEIN: ubiquitin carboxyl-terminal hydrolase 15-like [Phoenix dactylifera]
MLQPREADIPGLFLFLVVLPLVSYILLGIWKETSKKKARISVLAQFAAEEALRVDAMASADVIPDGPSLKTGFHECARCFAPATTRCSRCKSVRYCSGKCQIIHWRLGHKQECQQWQDTSSNLSGGLSPVPQNSLLDDVKSSFLGNDIELPLHGDLLGNVSSDPCVMKLDTPQDSAAGRKLSEKQALNRSKSVAFKNDESAACAYDEAISADGQTIYSSSLFTEFSSKDRPLEHKLGTANFTPDDGTHEIRDTSRSSTAKSALHQSHKLADETRNGLKASSSPGISVPSHVDKNVINGCGVGANITSEKAEFFEGGFCSASETVDSSYSAENFSPKGSIVFKKPPYTLGRTASLPQKSAERASREYPSQGKERHAHMDNESRNSRTSVAQGCNGVSNMEGAKVAGSKKPSKVLKRNLMSLINDKKNKVCQLVFSYEDLVRLFQCEVWGISPRGLLNCGNSCYANAVLQCLTCTKPLMVYLLQRSHSRTCRAKDWCLMCELEQHVSMLREGGGPLSPGRILSNMKNIGCRMGGGNQEDAHEFLRLLVMSMQSTCLEGFGGEKEVDPKLQETTLVQQIFGGRLKSKVKCLRCHIESERYENIMDLTLEIHGWVETLEDALTQFTASEDLDGENMYRCGRCSAYVKARKQLSIHEVPNILTIVLKRFQTGKYGKINKCVTFPDMLDMIPFVTGTADNPPLYMLYAVVVHLDTLNASFSGHYVSYVKDLQGTWLRIDDCEVQAVPQSQVMSEGAYMLFYSRSFPRPPRAYIDKAPSQAAAYAKHNASKIQKSSKHGKQKQTEGPFTPENLAYMQNDFRPQNREGIIKDPTTDCMVQSSSRNMLPTGATYADSSSMDFSDATSSDWSLFTSSDESSFTTESTRDSFSTVDYGDHATLDPISSIFGPLYVPEYSHSNGISCKEFSAWRPQTRFFSESMGFVMDSSMPSQSLGNVHKERISNRSMLFQPSRLSLARSYGLYGQYGRNPKDDFVQTTGFCDM